MTKKDNNTYIDAIKRSYSIAETLRYLGLKPSGGNYRIIHNKINELNIDISHFVGKQWRKKPKYKPLSELLINGSNYQSYKLKNKLLSEKIKEHRCEECGLSKWLDKPIPLELHHINGNNKDNRLENLQLLCPNCHALTDNYRGKNKNNLHN